jgi:short-subunit dehydrogenase
MAAARSGQRLEDLKRDIESAGRGSCQTLVLDVSEPMECIREIKTAIALRPPDIAVINAGIGQYGPFVHSPWHDITPILRTNIDGALACVHAVLPAMIARKRGSLVLISSTIGKRALPYNAAYCASKAALLGFADSLRLETRPYGVHVGVVCPARTETSFFDRMNYSTPQGKNRKLPTSSPEHVADAIMRCVDKRRREIVVSAGGKLFAFVGTHFPRISDFLLYHSVPRPTES